MVQKLSVVSKRYMEYQCNIFLRTRNSELKNKIWAFEVTDADIASIKKASREQHTKSLKASSVEQDILLSTLMKV